MLWGPGWGLGQRVSMAYSLLIASLHLETIPILFSPHSLVTTISRSVCYKFDSLDIFYVFSSTNQMHGTCSQSRQASAAKVRLFIIFSLLWQLEPEYLWLRPAVPCQALQYSLCSSCISTTGPGGKFRILETKNRNSTENGYRRTL